MKLSDFNPTQNTSSLTAGEAITARDLVAIDGYSGKGYAVDNCNFAAIVNIDYGTAQTSAATGRVVAQTSVVASQSIAYARQAVTVNSAGYIFTLTDYGAAAGLKLSKFASNGQLIGFVDIATVTTHYNHHLVLLSNGNLACIAYVGSNIKFGVYDANLTEIKALTTVAASYAYFGACALSGGGFAVLYKNNSGSPLQSQLVTYNNSGTVVQAATTVWTRTGTDGEQYHKLKQLSSGNLSVAIYSNNTVSSIGLYYAVITTAGAIVQAFTSLDTTASLAYYPELAVMTGYFAVSLPNGTDQKAYIFNNAGAAQGSAFSAATTAGNSLNKTVLVTDSTAFYLVWHRSSDSKCCTTKLPVTGTGYTTQITTTSTTQYNFYISGFYEDGLICCISQTATATAPQVWVISTATGQLVDPAGTTFGSAAGTTAGQYQNVVGGGDRSFVALYDYATTAATNLCVGKYAKTAVIGVAQASAAADAAVRMYSEAGSYETTFNAGLAAGFDHSTNTLTGNKGAILPYSVTLTGVGG